MKHTFIRSGVFRFLLLPFVFVCALSAAFGAFSEDKTLLYPEEFELCSSEEGADILYAASIHFDLDSIEKVWISPSDTTMLFAEHGFCVQDLFVHNRDTLTGYYVHPRLIKVVGLVLDICKAYEAKTGYTSDVRINSVVRSVPYNRRIGGVRNSEHLEPVGHAVDIRFAFGQNARRYNLHFASAIHLRNETFEKLINAGARSFGLYPWGIHFGVRNRPTAPRVFKGTPYAVWDKTRRL